MKTFIIFVLLAMAMNIASASRLLSPRGKELHTPQEQFPQQPPQQFPQQQFPIPYPPQQSQEPSPYQQYPQQQPSGSDVISICGL
uniref:Fast omega gliadin n=1 Tax=Triticum aestivum TaxID=4565 RepID=A0A0N9MGG3_WHEAT|nr:fast omega gliadin [Triticum aestivum]